MSASVDTLCLGNISWSTLDVHSLMALLSLTHLFRLCVTTTCTLRPSPTSTPPTSQVKVDEAEIQASLSINTLVALLSHIDVDLLVFYGDCEVLDISSYSPSLPQVCH